MDDTPTRNDRSPRPTPPRKPPAPSDESFLKRYGGVMVYWVVFMGILGTMVFINEKFPRMVGVHFSMWTADVFGWIMRVLGMGGKVDGIYITNPYCRFHIIGECTAY